MTVKTIRFGAGSHEPIMHRLRTGNATADEWARWEQETSEQNLDVLQELGVSSVHIACTKGFGLEAEKPLIERAATFAVRAKARGIATSVYVQGFPVYYEAFLYEKPEAVDWLLRNQAGDFVPWGGQTFRRWMDFTRREFLEYQLTVLDYVLKQYHFPHVFMDNTIPPAPYTESARQSFRNYLKKKFDSKLAMREFGLPGFDAVDLPHFDPVYWPSDAYRIVKDPLLQEWSYWRSETTAEWVRSIAGFIKSVAPATEFETSSGCDSLRYNRLFVSGMGFEDIIGAVDSTHMEESGWRPGVVESKVVAKGIVVMDERSPDAAQAKAAVDLRISTDARFHKILQNYGKGNGFGFWGECDRASKLVAMAHGVTFSAKADHMGSIGPLLAHPAMADDVKDILQWLGAHHEILERREERVAPIAVWRGTVTQGFIRHKPVWEACAIEQMLFEQHLPFTILFDGVLEKALASLKVLILPGTACVSQRQIEGITAFVEQGGRLLLLGEAGTRDERTRVRGRYAFAHLFGSAMPELAHIGPPHWVPEIDFGRMPDTLGASFGKGQVIFMKSIVPQTTLDLTRDVYMPERQVMSKDILPPANETRIMTAVMNLYGAGKLRVEAPRWTLCEYWKHKGGLLVCFVNLRKGHEGGPATLHLGDFSATEAILHSWQDLAPQTVAVKDGKITIQHLADFCAIELRA